MMNNTLGTALITVAGALLTAVVAGIVALVTARRTARFASVNADAQISRDLTVNRQTLMHQSTDAAYRDLDAWICRVTDQADDLCFGDDIQNLPRHQRDDYHVCVTLHQGVLRLPQGGQYLWSPGVAELVEDLRDQAVAMAQAVVLQGLGWPDEHGHDKLDEIAASLRVAMRDHLAQPAQEPSGTDR